MLAPIRGSLLFLSIIMPFKHTVFWQRAAKESKLKSMMQVTLIPIKVSRSG
jgi:hypothetical protein